MHYEQGVPVPDFESELENTEAAISRVTDEISRGNQNIGLKIALTVLIQKRYALRRSNQ